METGVAEKIDEQVKEGDKETLARLLNEIKPKITKGDKFRACLHFGKSEEPLDLQTIHRYLLGKPDEMRNFEFGLNLLSYFRGCAAANEINMKLKESITI